MLTLCVGGSRTPGRSRSLGLTADMRNFQPPFRFGLGIGSRWSLLSHCLGTHDGTQRLWNRFGLPHKSFIGSHSPLRLIPLVRARDTTTAPAGRTPRAGSPA